MSRITRRSLIASGAALSLGVGSREALAKEGDGRRYRFATPEQRVDWGGAIICVRAPMDRVLEHVVDYRSYSEILPKMQTSKILKRKDETAHVYLRAPILRGLASIWGVTRFEGPKPWKWGGKKVVASLVKGNVHEFVGVWKTHPCPNHTVLRLEMVIDVKVPVPASVVTDQTMWAADQAVTTVRGLAEKDTS